MSASSGPIHYFLFHGIHDVMKAEEALKSRGAVFELVPVPRVLSSDCGVCIALKNLPRELRALLLSFNFDRCFVFDGKEYQHIDETSI